MDGAPSGKARTKHRAVFHVFLPPFIQDATWSYLLQDRDPNTIIAGFDIHHIRPDRACPLMPSVFFLPTNHSADNRRT